ARRAAAPSRPAHRTATHAVTARTRRARSRPLPRPPGVPSASISPRGSGWFCVHRHGRPPLRRENCTKAPAGCNGSASPPTRRAARTAPVQRVARGGTRVAPMEVMRAPPPQEVQTPFFTPSPFAGLSCAGERRREIRLRLVRWTLLIALQVAALLVLLEFASHAAANHCFFKDMLYSTGDVACPNGSEYRCDDGEWRALGLSCMPDGSVVVSR